MPRRYRATREQLHPSAAARARQNGTLYHVVQENLDTLYGAEDARDRVTQVREEGARGVSGVTAMPWLRPAQVREPLAVRTCARRHERGRSHARTGGSEGEADAKTSHEADGRRGPD
jgi:hypothetical protein